MTPTASRDLFLNRCDQRADLLRGRGRAVRELPDLCRDHGKPFAVLAGLRREDGRIQGKEAGLVRDVLDHGQDAADALGPFAQAVYHVRGAPCRGFDPVHAFDGLFDGAHAKLLGVGGNGLGERRGLLRVGLPPLSPMR